MNKIIVTIENFDDKLNTVIQKESGQESTWMALVRDFIFSLEGLGYSIRNHGKDFTIDDILNSDD